MISIKPLLALLFISLSSVTFAQETLAPIKPGMPGNKHGDIIAPLLDEQIATWCDFSKAIVVTKTNTLCAYVGKKTTLTPVKVSAKPTKIKSKKLAQAIPKDLTPTLYEMSEYENTES